jgi:hypothetical protein
MVTLTTRDGIVAALPGAKKIAYSWRVCRGHPAFDHEQAKIKTPVNNNTKRKH